MEQIYKNSLFLDMNSDLIDDEMKTMYSLSSEKYKHIDAFFKEIINKRATDVSCTILKENIDKAYLKSAAFNFFHSIIHSDLCFLFNFFFFTLNGQYNKAFQSIPKETKKKFEINTSKYINCSKEDVKLILLEGLLMCVSYCTYNTVNYKDVKNALYKDPSFEQFIDDILL